MSDPHTLIPYPAPRRFSPAVLLSAAAYSVPPPCGGARGLPPGSALARSTREGEEL